ncbi:DUF2637 domain-containing protein [Embleya hyalina]|uniref:DUF2637 domain-containing protein n=1 Tax=Embleya hyalina TaxID=516124 RepID=A0A401YER4_9ACTN|nr:DUF2637 domain-containing protein [Embleya hyalina]GCD93092.1 hypothetical protein EHYA_00735 [Embleya hyalina]
MYDGTGHDLSRSPVLPTPHGDAPPPLGSVDSWSMFDTGTPLDPLSPYDATQEWLLGSDLTRPAKPSDPGTPTTPADERRARGIGVPAGHRRRVPATPKPARQPATGIRVLDRLSHTMVAATVVLVAAISVLGAIITLEPLRHAAPAEHGLARWWPILLHGPWIVACLSILRSSLHHHRAAHSWVVAITFAGLSMALAVTEAPKNLHGIVGAALPAIAMTACLHQLVRQITLTRPPRRTNRDPRHNTRL